MNWINSLLGFRGNGGMWSRMVNNVNRRNTRGTTLSLIALGVGAVAYGMRRMTNR